MANENEVLPTPSGKGKYDNRITLHNILTDCGEDLSVFESRVVNALAATINPTEPAADGFKRQWMSVKTLADQTGESSKHLYNKLKPEEAWSNILSLYYKIEDQDSGEWKIVNIFSSFHYVPAERSHFGEAGIWFRFNPELAPFMLDLKRNFTVFYLEKFQKLSVKHAFKIYKMLYRTRKWHRRTFTLRAFRRHLNLENKYQRFSSLWQRVIQPSVADINRTTDLTVVAHAEHTGKKVTGVTFTYSIDENFLGCLKAHPDDDVINVHPIVPKWESEQEFIDYHWGAFIDQLSVKFDRAFKRLKKAEKDEYITRFLDEEFAKNTRFKRQKAKEARETIENEGIQSSKIYYEFFVLWCSPQIMKRPTEYDFISFCGRNDVIVFKDETGAYRLDQGAFDFSK